MECVYVLDVADGLSALFFFSLNFLQTPRSSSVATRRSMFRSPGILTALACATIILSRPDFSRTRREVTAMATALIPI